MILNKLLLTINEARYYLDEAVLEINKRNDSGRQPDLEDVKSEMLNAVNAIVEAVNAIDALK